MKKIIMLFMILLMFGCEEDQKQTIAVSIVPQARFVKAVVGDSYDVVTMIPPGFSPANYQPSPKEIAKFNEAELYFYIDVAAEAAILEMAEMKTIDLAQAVDQVYPARYFADGNDHDDQDDHDDHSHEGRDPHIWLSPKRVIVMIETIRDIMIDENPENKSLFEKNAMDYIEELNKLDSTLKETFSKLENRAFIIYHPSYGYFADDYGLEMIAIEDEGKAATIQGIETVIDLAKEKNIKFILYQEEFDSQQADIIAKEINGTTIKVAPLSIDYIKELNYISETLEEILE